MKNPRELNKIKAWAYFSPDGWMQHRSVGDTKKEAREYILGSHEKRRGVSHKDYEKAGYTLQRILITVKII